MAGARRQAGGEKTRTAAPRDRRNRRASLPKNGWIGPQGFGACPSDPSDPIVSDSIQLAEKTSAGRALFADRLTLSNQAPFSARQLRGD